ncbi:hypothetical protein ZIOFF_002997 [Zingiber officinale]|uniref:Uncharacterized protein n=1 Tax=Zingiber officinale TaxID=94328 RepID=A0A8J5I7V6_ZINOF|nr:hypothetical protein ZIOFF_002997 [Zingiber officinale]
MSSMELGEEKPGRGPAPTDDSGMRSLSNDTEGRKGRGTRARWDDARRSNPVAAVIDIAGQIDLTPRVSATSPTDDGVICDNRLLSSGGRFSIGKPTALGSPSLGDGAGLAVAGRILSASRGCLQSWAGACWKQRTIRSVVGDQSSFQKQNRSLHSVVGDQSLDRGRIRLNEYSPLLKSLNTVCKSHYSKLDDLLAKKRKADQQINWRVMQNVELKALKERLTYLKKKLAEDKAKVSKESNDLKLKYGSLELAFSIVR